MQVVLPPILPEVAFTSQTLRILLVAKDDDRAQLIRRAPAVSTTPRSLVDNASDGWDAQRQAAAGAYEALVLDDSLSDTDCETLLGRLKDIGMGAPSLVLTSAGSDKVAAGNDDYLPRADGLNGNMLVRAIVAMVQRQDLTEELAAARDQVAQATTILTELAHDLATPLGVVMGLTQVLLQDDNGLHADGRSCLEDVASEALRACEVESLAHKLAVARS